MSNLSDWMRENYGTYPFDTQEELDAYNASKEQEAAEHAAGWDAGGPVDESKSLRYQYGQIARMETDAEKRPWWKVW